MCNIFFLHYSPRTTAYWLNDSDAPKVREYAATLVSSAIQFAIGETVSEFRVCETSPHLQWAMQSQEHALWVYDLFVALAERTARKRRGGDTYREDFMFDLRFKSLLDILPTSQWTNPPLILPNAFCELPIDDISKWRIYYGSKRNAPYRKVKPPFWLLK